MNLTGIEAMLELLDASGVRYVFGNPGTTELPLTDALIDHPRIEYLLALQEIPVMAIADGYAQASRSPGVVNLHISCGLGNAMGMLYNAFRSNTPLIVTAGQQDGRLLFEEPILWGDMIRVVRPWTKWAAEVQQISDIPSAVRRAIQMCQTPPTGPVFLSLPLDVQMGRAELDTTPGRLPDVRTQPPVEALRQAATVLGDAKNPGVLVGSRIREADAVEALVVVAERLGAPVIHEAMTSHGRCGFPSDHPLAAGFLPFWSPDVRRLLEEFDVLLVAGMKLMRQYLYHEPTRAVPESIRLVQFDDDPWELGKNYPVEVGVLGHPQVGLEALGSELNRCMSVEQRTSATTRGIARAEKHTIVRKALREQAVAEQNIRPMTPRTVMEQVARVLPDNVALVEESPTTTEGYLERIGVLKNTEGYFAHQGWALGWGLNCAIGVQLAWPDRPVLGIIGDGSAMYGIQGLWTAAHYRIPVTLLVTNNREYRILKDCAKVLELPAACENRHLGMDLIEPQIDYVGIAASLGVAACRVDEPAALAEALEASFSSDSPQLIEAILRKPCKP